MEGGGDEEKKENKICTHEITLKERKIQLGQDILQELDCLPKAALPKQ